jgi:hypothetical protein
MRIQPETLRKVIATIGILRPDEIGCDDCYEQVDQFADMLRSGEAPDKILPLVEHHLKVCGNCHEEFDALLVALKAADKKNG